MITWPVTAVVAGQSRLGGTRIRIILNIVLILYYNTCVSDRYLKKNLVNPQILMKIRVLNGHDHFTAPWPIFLLVYCPALTRDIYNKYLSCYYSQRTIFLGVSLSNKKLLLIVRSRPFDHFLTVFIFLTCNFAFFKLPVVKF